MDDFDDELLALAGGGTGGAGSDSKPRGKAAKRKVKRAKVDMNSDSDMDMSSGSEAAAAAAGAVDSSDEEDSDSEEEATAANPYPLEGIYVNAADKAKIEAMGELEREAIIGDRKEELQKILDRENLKNMVRQSEAAGKRKSGRAAGRTGATEEKTKKLDELKRKREQKGKSAKDKGSDDEGGVKKRRKKFDSDDDWSAAGSDEDAEVDRFSEKQAARDERAQKKLADQAQLEDFASIQLTRTRATEICHAKFFEEYVKGMWVRVPIEGEAGGPDPKYRMGEIIGLRHARRYYEIKDGPVTVASNALFVIDIAKDKKMRALEQISNGPFTPGEVTYLVGLFYDRKLRRPSKKDFEKKKKAIDKYNDWRKDDEAVTAQLRAKNLFRQQGQAEVGGRLSVADRLRLQTERDMALQDNNPELAASLAAQLAAGAAGPNDGPMDSAAKMAEVNNRNRKANREQIRLAEIKASEARKAQMRALEKGEAVKVDASARLRINPKLTYEPRSSSASRAASPAPNGPSTNGTSTPNPSAAAAAVAKSAPAPAATNGAKPGLHSAASRFDDLVAKSITVDIDF